MLLAHWRVKLAAFLVLSAWAGGMATGGAIASDDQAALQADLGTSPSTPPTAETRALDLYNAHDCWRDKAPADMRGRVPGHVVVTRRNGRTVYGGPRLVSRALDQQFANKPAGLKIWAFCR